MQRRIPRKINTPSIIGGMAVLDLFGYCDHSIRLLQDTFCEFRIIKFQILQKQCGLTYPSQSF